MSFITSDNVWESAPEGSTVRVAVGVELRDKNRWRRDTGESSALVRPALCLWGRKWWTLALTRSQDAASALSSRLLDMHDIEDICVSVYGCVGGCVLVTHWTTCSECETGCVALWERVLYIWRACFVRRSRPQIMRTRNEVSVSTTASLALGGWRRVLFYS